jgi:multidrug efflux system outer membrane protein
MNRAAAALLCPLALCACAVGPNYHQPQVPTPPAFSEQRLTPEATAQTADLARWWGQIGDPELDSLIGRALTQNLDQQSAASRLREARQQVLVARSAFLPTVSGSAITARRDAQSGGSSQASGQTSGRTSGQSSGSTTAGATGSTGGAASPLSGLPKHLELYSLGVDASWEIDLFGGARRGVEAARAQAEAAEWQVRDSQVALTSEVARTYLSLRLAQARKAAAQADIARLNDLMGLVGARARAGVVTELDVNQQRQALQSRLAEVPQLDQQARAAIHALGILLAQPPSALEAELAPPKAQPPLPAVVPVGLPSDLLRRRPDIRASERQLASATAQIGVAVADEYPKIDLLGLASFAGTDLGSLLSTRNFSTTAIGRGSWSLFAGGRLRATVEARREEAQQAEFSYRQTILTALREVEDALSAYAADREREARLDDDLRTSQDTAALAEARYKAGLTTFLDVLQAEAGVTQAQDQLASARSARLTDLVTLYTALGGGWS